MKPRWMHPALAALAGLVLAAAPVRSQVLTPPLIGGLESAAYPDGPAALLFNPAALGMRYPSELAFTYADRRDAKNAWRALITRDRFGFGVSGEQDGPPTYTLGFSNGTDAMRAGIVTNWIPRPGKDRAADYRFGVLGHPHPWLSWGAVADHLSEPEVGGVRLDRSYTLGLGWRPLAHDRPRAHQLGTQVTLTADVQFLEKWEPGQYHPRFGAEIQPAPGISLRGIYLPKDRGFQLSVSLLGVQAAYHGQAGFDRDREVRYVTHSGSLHGGEDRTVLAPTYRRRVARVLIGGRLGDESLSGFSIYGPEHHVAVGTYHRQLERALDDPLTRGVLLELRGTSNMAQVEELRARIERLRAAGKPVVAYLEYGGGRGDLLLASACDRIVTSPDAFYAALGLRSERRYYRSLLEDWGVRFDRTSYGKYKSAFRNYSVDSIPAPDRQALEHNLDLSQEMFVSTIEKARGMDREELLTLLDGRVWPSRELVKAGLVDSVGYRETALATIGHLTGLGDKPRTVNLAHQHVRQRAWTVPARVAVVYASGAIEVGTSGNDILLGVYMGSETMSAQLRAAFHNPSVEAVVLRVESPGGSGLASNLIYHEALRLKRETKKPLIVSMGGVAASGGYEIAVAGDYIFADRFTITGSIGVLTVKPSLEGWYAKHGVRQQSFDRGDYMRGWSWGVDWDQTLQASADSATFDSYRDFVSSVAAGRNKTWDEIDAVAQGRVWFGTDALERDLVDRIGGLEDAIAEARTRAGIPKGEKIRVLEYRRPRPSFVQRLVGSWIANAWEQNTSMPQAGEPLFWLPADEMP